MTRSTSVGKEALAYCTSCKMDLGHTIVAMQGDRIAKVQCRTCKKEHQYKTPKGVSDPGVVIAKEKKTAASKAPKAEARPIELEWEKLMATHTKSPRKTYSIKTKFLPGEVIAHPSFGEGVIDKLIYPNKIEVVFRTDLKILIHGGE